MEYCGFTAKLLTELGGQVHANRDRVEVTSSGNYLLLEETKRHQKKRDREAGTDVSNVASRKAKKIEPEVISLL